MFYYDKRCRNISPWNNYSERSRMLQVTITSTVCGGCFSEDCDGCEGYEVTDEHIIDLPTRMEVCDVCEGEGKVVNPDIDAHGLSQEDFDADPDFREAYFGGAYDIVCNYCRGKRVVPTVHSDGLTGRLKAAHEAYLKQVEEDEEFERMCMAERRMGA